MKYLRSAIRIRMLVKMPIPFQNLLDNEVSHSGIPLSKLGKLVTKLAQQWKWSEKSTKTWETQYSSYKYFNFPNSKQTTHIACIKTIVEKIDEAPENRKLL